MPEPTRALAPFRLLCLAAPLLVACATIRPDAGPQALPADTIAEAKARPAGEFSPAGPNEYAREVDTNGDQKPDLVRYFAKESGESSASGEEGVLLRKEVDLNGDGKVDLWTWYGADGEVERQAYDLDLDGRVDVVVFHEKGQVVRKEIHHAFSEKANVFKFYEGGKLVRVERDRDGDGRVDTWEYWENDQIDRIGEDLDGDGNVDKWIKAHKTP